MYTLDRAGFALPRRPHRPYRPLLTSRRHIDLGRASSALCRSV